MPSFIWHIIRTLLLGLGSQQTIKTSFLTGRGHENTALYSPYYTKFLFILKGLRLNQLYTYFSYSFPSQFITKQQIQFPKVYDFRNHSIHSYLNMTAFKQISKFFRSNGCLFTTVLTILHFLLIFVIPRKMDLQKKKVSSPIMCKSSDGSSDSQSNRETIKVFLFKICITKLKFLKSTLTGLSHREYFILEEMTCNDQLFCFSETSMVLVSQCLFTSLWFVTNILPRRLVEQKHEVAKSTD